MDSVVQIVSFVSLLLILLYIVSFWIIFQKAKQPGWASIIPVYNFLIMCDIGKTNHKYAWFFLATYLVNLCFNFLEDALGLEPLLFGLLSFALQILQLVFLYPIFRGIAINFGKSEGYAWGLLLLGFIFFPILAFGSSTYQNQDIILDDVLDSGL